MYAQSHPDAARRNVAPEVESQTFWMNDMPTSKPAIQLVIFDLGRVLIRICDHWQEACERAGVTPPASLGDKAITSQILALGDEFESGRLAADDYYAQAAFVAELEPDDVQKIVTAWLKGPFPGVIDLVNELHAIAPTKNIKTACLSNTNETHWQLMHDDAQHQLPLRDLHHAFASHLIGCMKPAAAIYDHVEEETGTAPASILFFDDNEANIAAAKARGWHAMLIDTSAESPADQMRDVLHAHAIFS